MEAKIIKTTNKPWGYEKLFAFTDQYALKEIGFNKGARCSLQKHVQKHEHTYVMSGKVQVEEDDKDGNLLIHIYEAGQCYEEKPNARHRITALEDSIVLEVSTPHLDDVIRIEDDYGRSEN